MDERMSWLVALQKTDTRKREIQRLKESLPMELERLLTELEEERKKVQMAQERLLDLKLKRRRKEKDLEVQIEKVKRSQGRLLEVKTNKEYQALLREIEMGREANSALEEEILLLMEETDQLTEELKRMESELQVRESTTSERKGVIERRIRELEEEEALCDQERRRILENIDEQLIAQYERIATRNNGVAVSRVINGICQGCFVNIPPQLYNEILKSGPLVQCPFCLRFLYFEEQKEPTEGQQPQHQSQAK